MAIIGAHNKAITEIFLQIKHMILNLMQDFVILRIEVDCN